MTVVIVVKIRCPVSVENEHQVVRCPVSVENEHQVVFALETL